MGHSADAYLMYGYTLGDTEADDLSELPWFDEDGDSDFDDYLNNLLGVTYNDYDAMREARKAFGVDLQLSGYEFSTKHLVAAKSVVRVWDYGTESVDIQALLYAQREFDATLDNALVVMKWTPDAERGWILAAHYG
jgi:hypothetical protein